MRLDLWHDAFILSFGLQEWLWGIGLEHQPGPTDMKRRRLTCKTHCPHILPPATIPETKGIDHKQSERVQVLRLQEQEIPETYGIDHKQFERVQVLRLHEQEIPEKCDSAQASGSVQWESVMQGDREHQTPPWDLSQGFLAESKKSPCRA